MGSSGQLNPRQQDVLAATRLSKCALNRQAVMGEDAACYTMEPKGPFEQ